MGALDGLGLPKKYAVIGAVGVPIGTLLAGLLGISTPDFFDYLLGALAGGVGGYVGGLIRLRMGKNS